MHVIRKRYLPVVFLAAVSAAAFATGTQAQTKLAEPLNSPSFWSTPTIPGYGRIHFLKSDAYMPDPTRSYKMVFWVHGAPKSPTKVNGGLDHVARAVNLYVAAGVPLSHLKIVVIVSGGATALAIDNAHYFARYGVDNPNLKLIKLLRDKADVDVAVCTQAVAEHGFQENWVAPTVTRALSGLTTVLDLQLKGYALMPLG